MPPVPTPRTARSTNQSINSQRPSSQANLDQRIRCFGNPTTAVGYATHAGLNHLYLLTDMSDTHVTPNTPMAIEPDDR